MDDTSSRRAVLGAGATAVASALSGCSLDNPEVAGGHLFVENTRTGDFRIRLVVTEGSTTPESDGEGDRVVDGWYRVPADTALEFEEVLQTGNAYTVSVHRPTVSAEDRVDVTVQPCADDDGVRDVSVRVRPDGMGIVPWPCDESYTQGEMEYVEPDEYQMDSPPAEAATPTDD